MNLKDDDIVSAVALVAESDDDPDAVAEIIAPSEPNGHVDAEPNGHVDEEGAVE
jgi:hypothetical protein